MRHKEYVISHPTWTMLIYRHWKRFNLSFAVMYKPWMFLFGVELGQGIIAVDVGPLCIAAGCIKERVE